MTKYGMNQLLGKGHRRVSFQWNLTEKDMSAILTANKVI